MAAAAERPPLIGQWPAVWQVRRLWPGTREWAPPGSRCYGELKPGSSPRPAGRSRASLQLPSIPKRANTALTRCTRLGQMNSFARKDCSHRRRGASPPPSMCFLRGRRAQLPGERSSSTLTTLWPRPPHTPLWALMAPRPRTLAGQLSVCALSCRRPTEAQTRRNDYH